MDRRCVAVVTRRSSARYGLQCGSTGAVRVGLGEWVCGSHHNHGWSRALIDRRCAAAVSGHGKANVGERCPWNGSVQLGEDWLCGTHFRTGYVHFSAMPAAPAPGVVSMAERMRAVVEGV